MLTTDAEIRIIDLVMNSDATRPLDAAHWPLDLLEDDRQQYVHHQAITVVSPRYDRRPRQGFGLPDRQAPVAEVAAGPPGPEDLPTRIAAFRLFCGFERLTRSGRFEDALIDDPFDAEGTTPMKVTKAGWRSIDPASTPRDSSHGQHAHRAISLRLVNT